MKKTRVAGLLAGVLLVAGAGTASAGQIPLGPFGRIESSGSREVQVDGSSSSPLTAAHPWADGYVAVTANGDNGDPGICAAGDNDYWYYQYNAPARDCNAGLADEENIGYLTGG